MEFPIKFAPLFIPLRRRLQTAIVFYYCTIFLVSGQIATALLIYLLFTKYYFITIAYIFWYIFDHETPKRGGRPLNWYRRFFIWKLYAEYFPVRLIKTADIPADRNYIFGLHPHGILCFSHFANFCSEATNFSKLYPGLKTHTAVLNFQFILPFQREQFLSLGACSASRESLNFILSEKPGKGNVACIIIGGAREVLDTIPNTMILTLKNRKGYARIALQNGASLVPVIAFGENELYQTMHHEEMSLSKRIQERLLRILTFAPPLIMGRGIFQYSFGLLPFRKEIFTVVGEPIDVPERITHPTDQQVNDLHSKYIEELTKLYENNKHKYGYADVELKIR